MESRPGVAVFKRGPVKTSQDKSRQVKTSQDKSRQVKTSQDKTSHWVRKNIKAKDLITYVDKPSTKTQGQRREG